MNGKNGVALVTTLIITLAIATMIGILSYLLFSSFHIEKNFKLYFNEFYECDGVNSIRQLDIVNLPVSDITKPSILISQMSTIPETSESYSYVIKYEFFKPAIIPGTSLNIFNNYFYSVQTQKGATTIKTLVSKIGPKM